jgi:phosphoribosylamine--glycine ligase
MSERVFGAAGSTVVVEEFLEGVEASFHLITDGERCLPLVSAKDHKALGDGDVGPNTGGMGTYAPNPLVNQELAKRIQVEIGEPVIRHMKSLGTPFRGVLYVGLMLTADGPKVLEFNVRFGDPETQVMMPLLDFDLLPVLHGAAQGRLPEGEFTFSEKASVCVVLASEGYPRSARKGDVIVGLDGDDGDHGQVFHAGTRSGDSGDILTHGGRVLGVTAWAGDLAVARERAYARVQGLCWEGMQYRRDIGLTVK